MNAAIEWIDAQTPHAKVLRNDPVTTSIEFEFDADVLAAIERIEAFQARVTREALEQPPGCCRAGITLKPRIRPLRWAED